MKKVKYVPQLKRNLISVSALKTLGVEVSIRDGFLKMTKDSMVVLKGVRRNNLYHYFVTFIDDYSWRCWVYTMKHKMKVLELFVEWKKNIEKSTRRKIKNSGQITEVSIRVTLS